MKQAATGKRPTDKSTKSPAPTKNLPDTRPKHIPITDLIKYRQKNLSINDIATLTGCSPQNVDARLKQVDLEGLDNFQEHKDKAFEHLQREAIESIEPGELKNVTPAQRVWIAGVLQDKIQVMRGQATEIVDHRHLVVDFNKAYEQLKQAVDKSVINLPDTCG